MLTLLLIVGHLILLWVLLLCIQFVMDSSEKAQRRTMIAGAGNGILFLLLVAIRLITEVNR